MEDWGGRAVQLAEGGGHALETQGVVREPLGEAFEEAVRALVEVAVQGDGEAGVAGGRGVERTAGGQGLLQEV